MLHSEVVLRVVGLVGRYSEHYPMVSDVQSTITSRVRVEDVKGLALVVLWDGWWLHLVRAAFDLRCHNSLIRHEVVSSPHDIIAVEDRQEGDHKPEEDQANT